MRGLLLMGPFARAEGGICERDAEPQAAPPGYQLLALVRRPERFEAQLRAMSAAYRELLRSGVDIRGFATQELARVEATRFWFSAGRGCVLTLTGDPAFALAIPRREPRELRWQESALALAGTYDPHELAKIKVLGLQPDVAMARRWYGKARELGAEEAAARLTRLGNQ